ncbi:MAG: tRNA threonylcarbamoyladenosine dehydratase [Hydrogenophaga sp.]|jgi:tRNA A37 threonylcarbamoyladenosine dehydratase|uniref:tRNA threonylcarbamoyladenosine dehydratase n=1 Tax=Hydrogenophaga sp. TaxID=1904254 RepID=UPI000EB90D89|nr:tRNA threonylcarbamoyladenosine dehydratase [Hydrogenophaga sp.]MDX9968311.1 tRNA threonylcarbamoyladenosine dehydratase [Hydrogenophaga sp.]HAJ13508.1 tRNA threonylcarbamoyladenosine dehydratase [Comamonadaceae bacterium]
MVALSAAASADPARRFGGLQRLYGIEPAQRIFDAHVVVAGIGGVGSWTVEALARSGVGHLTLIDMDHIAESNINRQIHALDSTLGAAKVEAMRARIAQINPDCQVRVIDDFVTPDNWPALLGDGAALPSALVDACDQIRAKTAMAHWAMRSGVPFITVGAAGGKRLAHAVDLADLAEVTHDPLLAQLRYRLRRHHGAARSGRIGVGCVFSREAVVPADASCVVEGGGDHSLNCHGYGSAVTVTATFGLCAASWVMNRLAQAGGGRR